LSYAVLTRASDIGAALEPGAKPACDNAFLLYVTGFRGNDQPVDSARNRFIRVRIFRGRVPMSRNRDLTIAAPTPYFHHMSDAAFVPRRHRVRGGGVVLANNHFRCRPCTIDSIAGRIMCRRRSE
jgi:hypothetical protein